eukprot:4203693-Prymnesium_polylepis.1
MVLRATSRAPCSCRRSTTRGPASGRPTSMPTRFARSSARRTRRCSCSPIWRGGTSAPPTPRNERSSGRSRSASWWMRCGSTMLKVGDAHIFVLRAWAVCKMTCVLETLRSAQSPARRVCAVHSTSVVELEECEHLQHLCVCASLIFATWTFLIPAPKNAWQSTCLWHVDMAPAPSLRTLCMRQLGDVYRQITDSISTCDDQVRVMDARKNELLVELGAISDALEEVHSCREALNESRECFVEDLADAMPNVTTSDILDQLLLSAP